IRLAYNNRLGNGPGTKNRPIAPRESGPVCQSSPISLSRKEGPVMIASYKLMGPKGDRQLILLKKNATLRKKHPSRRPGVAFCEAVQIRTCREVGIPESGTPNRKVASRKPTHDSK